MTDEEEYKSMLSACLNLFRSNQQAMLSFAKSQDKQDCAVILMDFVLRVTQNIYAIAILIRQSLRYHKLPFIKLSVGILLRNCFMDCITACYYGSLDEDKLKEELDVCDLDYVRAFFEELTVYKDKIQAVDPNWSDDLIENCFILGIEDTFPSYCEWKEKNGNIDTVARPRKDFRSDNSNGSVTLKDMYDALSSDVKYGEVIKSAYAYYKYFSQYEHFSRNGFGEALAKPSEDNINLVQAVNRLDKACGIFIMETSGGKNL